MKINSQLSHFLHSNWGPETSKKPFTLGPNQLITRFLRNISKHWHAFCHKNHIKPIKERIYAFNPMRAFDTDNQKYLKSTIRRGVIFYIAIALLAVPSGLCSMQHQVPDYEPPFDMSLLFQNNPKQVLDSLSATTNTQSEQENKTVSGAPDPVVAPESDSPYHEVIVRASESYRVDPALIRAIIMAESGYNPNAVSHRGARGLMQLMPTTAKSLGVEDAFDPALNIDGGVRYFKKLLDRFKGDVELALAAYNAGSRYVRKYNGVPPFRATRLYIKKVLHYHKKYKQEMAANETVEPSV